MATKIFTTILKQYLQLNILYVMNTFDIMFPAEKHFQSSQFEHITKQINKLGLIFKWKSCPKIDWTKKSNSIELNQVELVQE